MPDALLVAEDVRAKLFAALAPVMAASEREAIGRCNPAHLRYVVQVHPLVLQIVLAPDEGRPARRIAAFPATVLPDHGVALSAAVNSFAAGVLASLPARTAEAVMLNAAAAPDGGLAVFADPADEAAVLILAEGDLGQSVIVGALVDAPETMH